MIIRGLEGLKTRLLNPGPGRPPNKKEFPPSLFPQLFYRQEAQLLEKADLVIADLTDPDFKIGFLVSQALVLRKPVLGLFWQSIEREKISAWEESDLLFIDSFDQGNIRSVLRQFLKFVRQRKGRRGKLIVIDGTDGSGKETQAKLLLDYLKKKGLRSKYIDFPRYYSSFHGGMVGRYLRGEFGSLSEVNPYLASLTYALDRLTAREELEDWLKAGNLIVANRYTSSNMAHQTGRVRPKEREKFLNWLIEMEYRIHKLPKEDVVLFLHMPAGVGQKLVGKKEKREYTGKKKRDLHEQSKAHLKEAEKMYLYLAKKFNHWQKIECLDKKGQILSRHKIHQKILAVLRQKEIVQDS